MAGASKEAGGGGNLPPLSTRTLRQRIRTALRLAVRNFVTAGGFKAGIAVLLLVGKAVLARSLKKVTIPALTAIATDSARFGSFVALMTGGYKALEAGLSSVAPGVDARLRTIAAGFTSSALAAAIEDKTRRTQYALYLLCRSLAFGYFAGIKRGLVPYWEHGDVLLMAVANLQILYSYMLAPDTLNRGYLGFLHTHGAKSQGQLTALRKEVIGGGWTPAAGDAFNPPNPHGLTVPTCVITHAHEASCLVAFAEFWVKSLPRSFKLYAPLNFILGGIMKRKKLVADPVSFVRNALYSSARSTVFLSSYCSMAWLMFCFFNRVSHKTSLAAHRWLMVYSLGAFSGSCVVMDQKPRRIELALYCLRFSIEGMWNMARRHGMVRNIKNGEILVFAASMSALLHWHTNERDVLTKSWQWIMGSLFPQQRRAGGGSTGSISKRLAPRPDDDERRVEIARRQERDRVSA